MRSARYAGEGATDGQNNAALVARLRGAPDRSAHYVCVLVAMAPLELYTRAERMAFSSFFLPSAVYLLDHGADVNAIDQSQRRPLTYALAMDDHKWADLLKKHGAHE